MNQKQQLIILATVPKVTGGMSIVSSALVVADVILDSRKRKTSYHRLMLGMSVADMLSSIAFFAGTWVRPKLSNWGDIGSVTSCDITGFLGKFTGFLGQFGIIVVILYNMSLSTYYLLMLKLRWNSPKINFFESWFHAINWTTGLSVAVVGATKKMYGNAFYLCWNGSYPVNCDSPETCVRGWNYAAYRWVFFFSVIWISLVYNIVTMTLVYFSVRKLEEPVQIDHNSNANNNIDNTTDIIPPAPKQQNTRKSKRVMTQAFLYVGAVFLTWTWSTITRIILSINNKSYFPLLVLGMIFTPLQGFFNALIYFRYKLLKLCKQKKRGRPNNDSNMRDADRENEDSPQSKFSLRQWIAAKDKTGMGGRDFLPTPVPDNVTLQEARMLRDNLEANGKYSRVEIDEFGEELFGSQFVSPSVASDSDLTIVGGLEQQPANDEDEEPVPDWIRRFMLAIENSSDGEEDAENDYYRLPFV